MRLKRDENGVVTPIGTAPSAAAQVPSIKEQLAAPPSETQEEKQSSRKPIGAEEIDKARSICIRYLNSKRRYDERVKDNYDLFNLLYNDRNAPDRMTDDSGMAYDALVDKKVGAQALNVILNKHADAMDNYPEAVCMPRAKDDEEVAKTISSVLPCVFERCGFEKTYSDIWWDKLVGGAGCYAVTWDNTLSNGLGDASVRRCDIKSMAWKPFVEDIQDSPHLFYLDLMDIEELREKYPQLRDLSTDAIGLEEYRTYDNENRTHGKAVVFDWYYKKDGVLHFCKFCGRQVIFATENEEGYENGLYEHGLYPFVIDPLFVLRDTPVSFSFIDVCRAPQMWLDTLRNDILRNIRVNSQPRNLYSAAAGVHADDLADLSKTWIEAEGMNLNEIVRPIEAKDIASGALSMYQALTDEMKETTGTNDASAGASAAGVTSGAAISALQEAGGKISRDINKQSYFAFTQVCYMIIELMRQFYTESRYYRIVGDSNEAEYIIFDNSGMIAQETEDEGSGEIFERLPIFDIEIKAQRSNPYTKLANNQMMMDMFRAGMFAPENADAALVALEGMDFDGKGKIVEMLRRNRGLLQQVQQLQGELQVSNAMVQQQEADLQALPVPVSEGAKK